jgi:hypothetical protein
MFVTLSAFALHPDDSFRIAGQVVSGIGLGAPELEKPSGERARSGWWWSTARVFLWESTFVLHPHTSTARGNDAGDDLREPPSHAGRPAAQAVAERGIEPKQTGDPRWTDAATLPQALESRAPLRSKSSRNG